MALLDRASVIPGAVEESLTISSASNDQGCLDFARHDKKLRCAIENTGRSLAATFDVETETLHFLDQHVKRFRGARFERVITFHDGFINPGTSLHVVGFHGQQLLKGVSSTVRFQRPHLHLAKTMAPLLALPPERL